MLVDVDIDALNDWLVADLSYECDPALLTAVRIAQGVYLVPMYTHNGYWNPLSLYPFSACIEYELHTQSSSVVTSFRYEQLISSPLSYIILVNVWQHDDDNRRMFAYKVVDNAS